jgi:hypothetical protein
MNNLTDEEVEVLATEEQKQMALSVAIDAHDKAGTYFDELRKLVRREHFEIYE